MVAVVDAKPDKRRAEEKGQDMRPPREKQHGRRADEEPRAKREKSRQKKAKAAKEQKADQHDGGERDGAKHIDLALRRLGRKAGMERRPRQRDAVHARRKRNEARDVARRSCRVARQQDGPFGKPGRKGAKARHEVVEKVVGVVRLRKEADARIVAAHRRADDLVRLARLKLGAVPAGEKPLAAGADKLKDVRRVDRRVKGEDLTAELRALLVGAEDANLRRGLL